MIHHEPQRWRYCAVHAVNALIGYAAYTEEDFEQVALQLEEEIGSVGQSHRWMGRSIWKMGNYDVNVIACILESRGLEVKWHDKRVVPTVSYLNDERCMGLLMNSYIRPWWRLKGLLGSSRHWSTLKRVQQAYYLIDSLEKQPVCWQQEETVENHLKQILEQGGELLWVFYQEPYNNHTTTSNNT